MSDNATFDNLARYPDRHEDNYWHTKGEIIQSQQDGTFFAFRINVTENRYGNWEDTVYAVWEQQGNTRFLEDDIIEFVALLGGLHTYESILGASITLPFMRIERIYLVEEAPQPDCAFVQRNSSSPKATPDPSLAYANTNANLRAGPSTDFGLVGGLNKGDSVQPVARTIDGSWLQLRRGAWIYAPLLNGVNPDLPIATDVPPTPIPPTPTRELTFEEWRSQAANLTYDDITRYPDQHRGKLWYAKGSVLSPSRSDSGELELIIFVTKHEYGLWDNSVYVRLGTEPIAYAIENNMYEFLRFFAEGVIVEFVAELDGVDGILYPEPQMNLRAFRIIGKD